MLLYCMLLASTDKLVWVTMPDWSDRELAKFCTVLPPASVAAKYIFSSSLWHSKVPLTRFWSPFMAKSLLFDAEPLFPSSHFFTSNSFRLQRTCVRSKKLLNSLLLASFYTKLTSEFEKTPQPWQTKNNLLWTLSVRTHLPTSSYKYLQHPFARQWLNTNSDLWTIHGPYTKSADIHVCSKARPAYIIAQIYTWQQTARGSQDINFCMLDLSLHLHIPIFTSTFKSPLLQRVIKTNNNLSPHVL